LIDDKVGAPEQDRDGHQFADQLHGVARRVAEREHSKTGADIAGELLLPAALHLRLHRHRLQGFDAVDALDEKGLVLGSAREFLV